jgi:hypothetical protein
MRMAVLCLLLLGCGPVLLGEEHGHARDAGSKVDAAAVTDADADAGADVNLDAAATGSAPLLVAVSVRPLDCGKCFDLSANAASGRPPYAFEWEDGSLGTKRLVCVDDAALTLSVIAHDSAGARSAKHTVRLESPGDASCPMPPPDPPPAPKLCLENPSFEGTAAPNLGQANAFDAPPWSTCTTPAVSNMPAIADENIAPNVVTVPMPVHGSTFLALGEGDQVSQPFCAAIRDGAALSVELDLSRIDVGTGIVPQTEQVFLEIWGGLAVDCSVHELLWASPALKVGWKRFCVTLRPPAFVTQLTLRANTDKTLASSAYLLVDNLKPVDGCR